MATEQEGHTPGPWFIAAQNDGIVIIDGPPSPAPYDGPIPKAHGPAVVATPNWRLAEYEANARLIAAAPDLLEALREILGPLNVCSDNRNVRDDQVLPVDMTMGELRKARAAIARATGEA